MSSTIQRTKAQAIFFLLGAVLVGGALGFTANRAMSSIGRGQATSKSSRAQLADRLELDAAQRQMLDSVLDERNEKMKVLLAPRPAAAGFAPVCGPCRDPRRVCRRDSRRRWDQVLLEMARDSAPVCQALIRGPLPRQSGAYSFHAYAVSCGETLPGHVSRAASSVGARACVCERRRHFRFAAHGCALRGIPND